MLMNNVFTKDKLIDCLNNIGLWVKKDDTLPYSYDRTLYVNTKEDKINAHKALLISLEKKEADRLSIIDTKTSQIITYTGIIFSALSLFLPVLLDKVSDQPLYVRIFFIVVLIFAFIFYILTIHNAIRNYNIGEFIYAGSDPNNVIKYQEKSVNEFTNIEIQDLLYSYNRNLKTNNDKANNLIYAYNTFRIANIMNAILGVVLCFSLLFAKQKDKSITIKNPIQIQNLDSTTNAIIKSINEKAIEYKQPCKCSNDSNPVKK